MKKTVSILIAITLLLTLALPALAAEPQADADTQASCSHSSYTTSYIISYEDISESYHKVYRNERRICKSCNSVFYTGASEFVGLEDHPDYTFFKGEHVGDYTQHYYIYAISCTTCKAWYEKHIPAYCTAVRCIDPYSLGPVREVQ